MHSPKIQEEKRVTFWEGISRAIKHSVFFLGKTGLGLLESETYGERIIFLSDNMMYLRV